MLELSSTGTYKIDASDLDIKSHNGNELRSTCPLCRDSREHPNDPSLAIDATSGAGMCHHCGKHVIVKDFVRTLKKKYPPRVIQEPKEEPDFEGKISELDYTCKEFLNKRCIDPEVAIRQHVGTHIIGGIPYLAFPFMENGRAVNVQYKRADGKEKGFQFEKGGKMIPWNIDCINAENVHGPLYITEGMMDAIALIQSGYPSTISVPNGVNSKMEVFDKYKEIIKRRFTHIVFAGDNDEPGIKLRDKVKDYFNDIDVSTVTWKCRDFKGKDANDTLECMGTEEVAFCIRNTKFDDEEDYTTARCNNSALWDLYENGCPEGLGIGIKEVDEIFRLLPNYMYVVSGYPGSGKSSFINYVSMCMLHKHGWRTLFYSPEKMPESNHMKELISIVAGKKFDKRILDRDEMIKADEYLSGNVIHINERITNLDKLLRVAEKIIRRNDIKLFVIDPFLYLNINNVGGTSESTRITEMVKKIEQFAKDNKVAVIVVAHPRKPNLMAERPDLMLKPFEVSGSSGFANTCDEFIWIERPNIDGNTMSISCSKCRYDFLGKLGETKLEFDTKNGRYRGKDDDRDRSAILYNSWADDKLLYGRENVSDFISTAPF